MKIDNTNFRYRLELAKELNLLKMVLNSCNVPKRSIDSIDSAIRSLKDQNNLPPTRLDTKTNQVIGTPISWGYDIHGFIIQIDISNNIQYPKTVKRTFLEFSINLRGEYFDYSKEFRDPFKHLEFNIVIEGKSRKEKDHILSYHLDRHIEGGNPSNEVHPIYHFQIGGRKIGGYKSSGKNFGNQLIIDSPRFMHYPMDFITGLDFVLSNFAPDLWRQLKRDIRYQRILRSSQERTIKPFIANMANYFGFHKIEDLWNSKGICPQLV